MRAEGATSVTLPSGVGMLFESSGGVMGYKPQTFGWSFFGLTRVTDNRDTRQLQYTAGVKAEMGGHMLHVDLVNPCSALQVGHTVRA